jgi:hypothetical protein
MGFVAATVVREFCGRFSVAGFAAVIRGIADAPIVL